MKNRKLRCGASGFLVVSMKWLTFLTFFKGYCYTPRYFSKEKRVMRVQAQQVSFILFNVVSAGKIKDKK